MLLLQMIDAAALTALGIGVVVITFREYLHAAWTFRLALLGIAWCALALAVNRLGTLENEHFHMAVLRVVLDWLLAGLAGLRAWRCQPFSANRASAQPL